jgi:hypothetical protein
MAYNILLVTDRSIYYHMTRSDMNYLLYYTVYLNINGTQLQSLPSIVDFMVTNIRLLAPLTRRQ